MCYWLLLPPDYFSPSDPTYLLAFLWCIFSYTSTFKDNNTVSLKSSVYILRKPQIINKDIPMLAEIIQYKYECEKEKVR